jgi:acyl-CoA synthetase (AMP-forming)/AMP-acid ligase II
MPFNLAQMICSKHQDAIFRIAIEELRCSGTNTYTFGGIDYLSDKFATVLQNCGIRQSDVVVVILAPSAALVVAHFGILKLGAIVAPFSVESRLDVLNDLIKESQAKALVIEEILFNESEKPLVDSDDMQIFVASDYVSKSDFGNRGKGFWREINFANADFKITATNETTPAYVFYEQKAKNLKRHILNHGSILSPSQLSMRPEDKSFDEVVLSYASSNWSSTASLLKELLTALYSGQQIRTGNETE